MLPCMQDRRRHCQPSVITRFPCAARIRLRSSVQGLGKQLPNRFFRFKRGRLYQTRLFWVISKKIVEIVGHTGTGPKRHKTSALQTLLSISTQAHPVILLHMASFNADEYEMELPRLALAGLDKMSTEAIRRILRVSTRVPANPSCALR